MSTILLDGEKMDVSEGRTLGSVLPHHPPGCCVGIIRPSTQEQAKTGSLALSTTSGEISIEFSAEMPISSNLWKLFKNSFFTGEIVTQQHSGRSHHFSVHRVNHISMREETLSWVVGI